MDKEQSTINQTLDKVTELASQELIFKPSPTTVKKSQGIKTEKLPNDQTNISPNAVEDDIPTTTSKRSSKDSIKDSSSRITSSNNYDLAVNLDRSKAENSDVSDSYISNQNSNSIAEEISNESKLSSTISESTEKNDLFGDLHSINSLASASIHTESPQKEIDSSKSSNSIPSEYANNSFESAEPSVVYTASASSHADQETISSKKSNSKKISDKTYPSITSVLSPAISAKNDSYSNTFVSSGDETSTSESQATTETASDLSDIEGRIRKLATELQRRRQIAKDLIKEKKKLEKERLKKQEEQLRAELNKVETFITKVKSEISDKSQKIVQSDAVVLPNETSPEKELPYAIKSTIDRNKPSKVASTVPTSSEDQLHSNEENINEISTESRNKKSKILSSGN